MAEKAAWNCAEEKGLDIVVVHPGTVMGPIIPPSINVSMLLILRILQALPAKSNGYQRVDCYGGLNQMRRDLCDGVGIARLLNATLVLPKFEVAVYWNESR